MTDIIHTLKNNESAHLNLLFDFLRFESISAVSEKTDDVRQCADWLKTFLGNAGFNNAKLIEPGFHPAVYADWLHAGNDKPTILIYGHYDVQPVTPLEKWTTPPFEPEIRNNWIYARGASDDKGQTLTHILALATILKETGTLPVNVKFFIEGEEEGGTEKTQEFVKKSADILSCDAVMLSDTSWPSHDIPTLIYALRGIAYFNVHVRGPNRDLHSGMVGGMVHNPLNAIGRLISKLQEDDGRILIPGIYDDVIAMTDAERSEFARFPHVDADMAADLGVNALWGETGFTSTERNWGRPSLDIHGIWGGYTDEGAKTVLPGECGFKMSLRLVPNQTPQKTSQLISDYLNTLCPPGITINVEPLHGGDPVMIDPNNPYIACAMDAIETGFGTRPLLVREGASIPISATFYDTLKVPIVMMGLGLNEDNIHSPNEKIRVDHFYNGIISCAHFYMKATDITL